MSAGRELSRRSWLALSLSVGAAPLLAEAAPGLNIRNEGAAGDGSTLDTRAIQSAIDRCGAAGGGAVVFPPGRYLTGTLRLRDRVTLALEAGAVILGSTRLADYPVLRDSIPSYTGGYTERCLIRADGVVDAGIRGQGAHAPATLCFAAGFRAIRLAITAGVGLVSSMIGSR